MDIASLVNTSSCSAVFLSCGSLQHGLWVLTLAKVVLQYPLAETCAANRTKFCILLGVFFLHISTQDEVSQLSTLGGKQQ